MTLTRHSLIKCRTQDCPFTPEEHDEWMELCARAPEHGHRHDQPSHQHHPKKGMGGKNSKSKVVAILCWPMHDRIDNADWGNAVKDIPGRGRVYFAWDLHGNTLIEKEVMPGEPEQRVRSQLDQREEGRDGQVLSDGAKEGTAPPQGAAEANTSAPALASSLSTKEESDGSDRPQGHQKDVRGDQGGEGEAVSAEVAALVAGGGRSDGDTEHRPPPLTHDQRVAKAKEIKDAEWGRQWLAGDTANAWEAEMGQEAWQYLGDFGYQPESLSNIMNVCAAVPKRLRGYNLRFSHFVVVAGENLEDMEMWLDKCAEEQWSVAEFRRQVKGTKPRVKRWSLEELDELLKKFVYESDEESVPYPTGPIGDAVIIFFQWLGEQA